MTATRFADGSPPDPAPERAPSARLRGEQSSSPEAGDAPDAETRTRLRHTLRILTAARHRDDRGAEPGSN